MEDRTLDVLVVSARGLEDVNFVSKLRVYVEASLAGEITSEQKSTTSVDKKRRRDPEWNFMMKFTINETTARLNRQFLVFNLRTKSTLGERDVGQVRVPVNELLVSADDNLMKYMTYQVRNPSGKPCGVLNFSYKFGNRNGGHFAGYPASAADGGPHHNFHPDVYPAAAAYGGPHHNFHPDVYPPPPRPETQFHPPPSSAPYGVYPPPFPFYERPPPRWY